MESAERFLLEAIALARQNIASGGQPFGAVLVKDGVAVATGVNEIHLTHDPTAHAELLAVRHASQILGTPRLTGCAVYASGHPCPMCMAAMRAAGIATVVYAYSNDDGAPFGFTSAAAYADLAKPFPEQSMQISYLPVRQEGLPELYAEWREAGSPRA